MREIVRGDFDANRLVEIADLKARSTILVVTGAASALLSMTTQRKNPTTQPDNNKRRASRNMLSSLDAAGQDNTGLAQVYEEDSSATRDVLYVDGNDYALNM